MLVELKDFKDKTIWINTDNIVCVYSTYNSDTGSLEPCVHVYMGDRCSTDISEETWTKLKTAIRVVHID